VAQSGNGGQERKLYIHEDPLGTTKKFTKGDGTEFDYLKYDAWGLPVQPNKLVNNDHGNYIAANFTGHPFDTVLSFYYAEARFYSSGDRNFISRDPMEQNGNNYNYCNNNPASYWDPSGMAAIPDLSKSNSFSTYAGIPAIRELNVSEYLSGSSPKVETPTSYFVQVGCIVISHKDTNMNTGETSWNEIILAYTMVGTYTPPSVFDKLTPKYSDLRYLYAFGVINNPDDQNSVQQSHVVSSVAMIGTVVGVSADTSRVGLNIENSIGGKTTPPLGYTQALKVVPYVGVAADVGIGIYSDYQSGLEPYRIEANASSTAVIGASSIVAGTLAETIIENALACSEAGLPGIIIGIAVGVFSYYAVINNNGKTTQELLADEFYNQYKYGIN